MPEGLEAKGSRLESKIPEEAWQGEVLGLNEAMEFVHQIASSGESLTAGDILTINSKVLSRTLNPHFGGELRKALVEMGVVIDGEYHFLVPVGPASLPPLFDRYTEQLTRRTSEIGYLTPVAEAIDLAAWAHQEFISIHPFIDGNGRTARLIVDYILKKAGLPYIADWRAANSEYKKVVYRSLTEEKSSLFKNFLANKLLLRLREIDKDDPSLRDSTREIGREIEQYIEGISPDAS